jgi:SAM-dependent methyltransferase
MNLRNKSSSFGLHSGKSAGTLKSDGVYIRTAGAHESDTDWENWGARDPYFGVLTDPRYRADKLTKTDLEAFFATGEENVDSVLRTCRSYFGSAFSPNSVLDFGCGVGRLLIPFSRHSTRVVGVDISPSMLAESRRNCALHGVNNVELAISDETLSQVPGEFDLVHSTIVLQHIEMERGLAIFARLIEKVRPGGVAAIHLTYGKEHVPNHYGAPLPPPEIMQKSPLSYLGDIVRWVLGALTRSPPALKESTAEYAVQPPLSNKSAATDDPPMHMHRYDLSKVAFILHKSRCDGFYAQFSDHGGELGVRIFTRRLLPNTT